MSYNNTVHINKWLLPLSWLYGIAVFLRNKLFDWNILKQKKYDIPVICVGNITVGGTGKTPHVEYLVSILKPHFKVAVLSRGYKRKTSGFVMAVHDSTASQIGDEPYQIWHKNPDVIVAVDSNRQRGIEKLLALSPDKRPDVILLDDAFQHRYVKPSYTILLTDFNRMMSQDKLLPAGRLREPVYLAEKANMIIVTKCPPDINPLEQRLIAKDVQAFPYQDLFYTSFEYGMVTPLFRKSSNTFPLNGLKDKDVLLVTGIANPRPLHKTIRKYTRKITDLRYPDHYQFSKKDIQKIKSAFDAIQGTNKIIIVTEKDAARLVALKSMDDNLKKHIYYLPIQVNFVNNEDKDTFNTKILEHVRKDS